MTTIDAFHVTERNLFKWCRRSWGYNYVDCLLPAVERRGALWTGRGLHFGLAAYYREMQRRQQELDTKNVEYYTPEASVAVDAWHEWLNRRLAEIEYDKLWEDEKSEIDQIDELVTSMLKGYAIYAEANDDFEVVAVEETIPMRVDGTYLWLIGTMDLIYRRRGKLWVRDHKGYASFVDPANLELDDQMTAYLWLVSKKYGEMPAGADYNQLRKKIPSEPLQLKSGGLSVAKSCDTTYEIYAAKLDELGLDHGPYNEFLQYLKGNEFYKRELISRSATELDNFGRQLKAELTDMRTCKRPYNRHMLYPNPGRDCSWGCSYRMLCQCEMTGGDLKGLIDMNYKIVEGKQE